MHCTARVHYGRFNRTRFDMHTYREMIHNSRWTPEFHPNLAELPAEWLPWLLDKESLTSRLKEFSGGAFQVRVLSERWATPTALEAMHLDGDTHRVVRIREVELLCRGTVMVFARSLIPVNVYRNELFTLSTMGNRPLGHLLFKGGRAGIGQRQIIRSLNDAGEPVYGRATPYRYGQGEILVCEYFINPQLLEKTW